MNENSSKSNASKNKTTFDSKLSPNKISTSIQDKYELLEYYIGKLDSRKKISDIYNFLLEFIQAIITNHLETIPGCVYLVNDETMEFKQITTHPYSAPDIQKLFDEELYMQIENGMVAWCTTNKRVVFTDSHRKKLAKNCILIPLFTIKRILGLVMLYTNLTESEISRESFQILNLACIQTSLYADVIEMYEKLKNAQSSLIQSEKLAVIGQIAAGIAHEINNPVGFVSSNSSTLQSYIDKIKQIMKMYSIGTEPQQIKEKEKEFKIEFILEDVNTLIQENIEGLARIAEIVQALKNFARIEQKDKKAKADINEGIKSALVMARNEIKYNADVKSELGEIQPVSCNIGEINQVFLNILVNAAQAIKSQKRDDRGYINVKTYEDTDFVYCEISDDGPGMSKKILDKIFEPFFTTKSAGKGTGLGLSISYDIITNRHKGDIEVKSEQGKGTSFIIKLPKDLEEENGN